jgi:hypothetical protein
MFNLIVGFIAGVVVGVLGTAIWVGYKECRKEKDDEEYGGWK